MKVTQEKLPASQMGLEIEIPAEMSKKTYEQVIQKLSRSANIPGFRKGKVPRHILLQQMGVTRIKATALEELIQEGLKQALKQESIEAIGNYQLRSDFDDLISQYQPGEPLTFQAAVDVQPEVRLGNYQSLSFKAEETVYDPSTVDKFLEERRAEQATLIPVEGRPAQMGDVAVVDYTSRLVGEQAEETEQEIAGGQAEDFQVELQEGKFIKDFLDGIVGMSPGETKEVSIQFPEDYPRDELANQPALFTITLKELKEKELPALDDDFAQEASEFETLAELRESLESQFRERAVQETATSKEQALLNELIKHIEVELPETLIEREVETLLTQTVMQLGQMGMDVKKMFTPEMVQNLRQRSRPEAITRITQTLALKEIGKQESIQVEPEAIQARISELMEQLSDQDIDPTRLREYVEGDLLKEKVIKWLEEHSTIDLVPKGSLSAEEEIQPAEETETPVEATVAAAEVAPETAVADSEESVSE